MTAFKKGQIVRYSDGPTALCRLMERHAGTTDGWHGTQFYGGVQFFSARDLVAASAADVEVFVAEQRARKART